MDISFNDDRWVMSATQLADDFGEERDPEVIFNVGFLPAGSGIGVTDSSSKRVEFFTSEAGAVARAISLGWVPPKVAFVTDIDSRSSGIFGTITFTRTTTNLTTGRFVDTSAPDPAADTLVGADPTDLTLRLVSSDTTLSYVLPEGFKSTGGTLGSGAQDVELIYDGSVIATFTIPTGTSDHIFSFAP